MPVKFTIKVKHQGQSSIEQHTSKKGRVVTRMIAGELENTVVDVTGKMIVTQGLAASLRYLKLMAIFFQRLVSRTPIDEDYIKDYNDETGEPIYHYADDDFIRDYWTVSYGKYSPLTAKYFIDNCGCTFMKFNDSREIEVIFREFTRFLGKNGSAFLKGARTLRGLHIENTHPDKKRYAKLEYGEYPKDGAIHKDSGNERPHGVAGGYSVQAPAGMFRLTEAELLAGKFTAPTVKLGKNSGRLQRIKSKSQLIELNKYLMGKKKLDATDIGNISRMYGL